MPVEAEDTTQGLKPKGIGDAPQDFFRAVFLDDNADDFTTEPHHPLKEPDRCFTAVKGQLRDACTGHILLEHL
jgi:hypothetical protein